VILAQTDKVDEVEGAVESAQVTGWQVLAAVLVLVAAYPVGRLARRLVKRSLRKSDNVPPALVYDVSRGAQGLIWPSAGAIALSLIGVGESWIVLVLIVVLLLVVLTVRPQIQNTSAGLVLTMRPSFGVGDQIEVMDTRRYSPRNRQPQHGARICRRHPNLHTKHVNARRNGPRIHRN
jgi:small conductance mechanosensitive channel